MELSKAEEILEGTIMSDASIVRKTSSCLFSMCSGGREHIDWLMTAYWALRALGINCSLPRLYYIMYKGKPYSRYILLSRIHPLLATQRLRWYPGDVKDVPEDIKLTPLSLACEFMGDGSSWYNNRNPEIGVAAELCTMSYTVRGIEIIEDRLRLLGITHLSRAVYSRCSKANGTSGIGIRILGPSIGQLMDIIEPHMVSSFKYKVKRPGSKARTSLAFPKLQKLTP